ncbi:MAG: glycosyltransferase [Planctomycetota bacterium]
MIFVCVGTQLPFDRLIGAVDDWARQRERTDVFAQIAGGKAPSFIKHAPFIDAEEVHQRLAKSEVAVSHAGMGTILTAMHVGTPLIIMPRRAELNEHRNEHQIETARSLVRPGQIFVAEDEHQLPGLIDEVLAAKHTPADANTTLGDDEAQHPRDRLIAALRGIVDPATA